MNAVARTFKSFVSSAPSQERRGSTFFSLESLFGIGSSGSASINHSTALTIPAFYNGVDQISNDIAKLPKGVYRKIDDGRESVDHPVKFLINKEPNRFMDSFTFHKIMTQAAVIRGNGLAAIVRNRNTAGIEEMLFIHPDDIRDIRLVNQELFYFTKYGVLTSDEVIHVMGYTDNGYCGKGIIQYAAETLGIAKKAQSFVSATFEDRGLGFGSVETDLEISNDKKKQIEAAINSKLTSPGKIKTVMLDEGMKYKPISLNMQEAQLIEQSKFSVIDICRFLNISPRKVKDYTINNYASAYQDSTDHVTDSIQPWAKKFENEYDRKLFNSSEKTTGLYTKFNDNYLLRGDLQAKGEYYSKMIFSGVMSRNEVRSMEELNKVDGLDEHLTPVNTKLPVEIQKALQNE